jgi:hypothetical protein
MVSIYTYIHTDSERDKNLAVMATKIHLIGRSTFYLNFFFFLKFLYPSFCIRRGSLYLLPF